MIRFFKQVCEKIHENRQVSNAFQEALNLAKQGEKDLALQKFQLLLAQRPANVYIRRQVLNLSIELHKEANLPSLNPK